MGVSFILIFMPAKNINYFYPISQLLTFFARNFKRNMLIDQGPRPSFCTY